jgi:lysophospholipase L1-like esterase
MLRYNRYLSPQGWTRTIARLNALVRRLADEEGVVLVDCERAMTGNARYFRDYVHFTPAGHKKMAELVGEKVRGLPLDVGRPHPNPFSEGEGMAGVNR